MGADDRPERSSKRKALVGIHKSEASLEVEAIALRRSRRSSNQPTYVERDVDDDDDDDAFVHPLPVVRPDTRPILNPSVSIDDDEKPLGSGQFHAPQSLIADNHLSHNIVSDPLHTIPICEGPSHVQFGASNIRIGGSDDGDASDQNEDDNDDNEDNGDDDDFTIDIHHKSPRPKRKHSRPNGAVKSRRRTRSVTNRIVSDNEHDLSIDSTDNDDHNSGSKPNKASTSIPARIRITGGRSSSARVIKRVDPYSPSIGTKSRRRSSSNDFASQVLQAETREQRYKRRHGDPSAQEPGTPYTSDARQSKKRKLSDGLQSSELSDDSDEQVIDGGHADDLDLDSAVNPNGSKSHPDKMSDEDEEPQVRRGRRSKRIRSTRAPTSHHTPLNGRSKLRNTASRAKNSDDDDDGKDDDEFHITNTEDESDDQMDDVVEEHEGSGAGPIDSQDDFTVTQSRRRSTRHNRKQQPRRTVPPRRSRRRRTTTQNNNTFAEEVAKSYRPKNESLRPSDYYRERAAVTSESSFSSAGGQVPVLRPRRPPRQAAARASDAIANNLNNIDFLQNPMAIEGGKPPRPKRTDRYNRHRGRLHPSGPDPYVSDNDDSHTGVNPIEPMQVDVDLSWQDIGGLDDHVKALKEMVFLPLMYPEVFEKFSMEAPKGVLFYGPPGTGKTLCARALAASCGSELVESVKVDGLQGSESVNAGVEGKGVVTDPTENSKVDRSGSEQPGGEGRDVLQPTSAVDVTQTGALEPAKLKTPDRTFKRTGDNLGKEPIVNPSIGGGAAAGNASGLGETDGNSIGHAAKLVRKKPRVAFFMRNGADCLSKWVGEAERQLRMTFEAAKRHQPAIIFFDEIDGLAPVRSSRQDQIHSSIVSTLLGLMDGLDSRGKIVVIGATNRVDAIDPALRRPGRFDRELIFTLPNALARRKILNIHTKKWCPPPKPHVLDAVSQMTVGYCGADLKALCSESAIRALRRRYPQIYTSLDKLLIDVDQVQVSTNDFLSAMSDVVPASHRSARTFARPLSPRLAPVLTESLRNCLSLLKRVFPQGLSNEANGLLADAPSPGHSPGSTKRSSEQLDELDDIESSDDNGEFDVKKMQNQISNASCTRASGMATSFLRHILRPRLLVCGEQGLGQGLLGAALLHYCEGCPVHAIDYPTLHSDLGARSPEEALMSAFREATRSLPSILYLPHLKMWWESASQSLQTTLLIAFKDLPSDLPLLVLATAEAGPLNLPPELLELFPDVHQLAAPSEQARRDLFQTVIQKIQEKPRISEATVKKRRRERAMEILPKAPPPKPKALSVDEEARRFQVESRHIRALRMEMRNFVETLLRDKRFKAFWTPVDPVSAPDYYDIIKVPMDIQKIAANVDRGIYPTVLAMVNDFDIMVRNAIQYNPPNTEVGAGILRRAHGLIDIVHAWVDNLNPSLVETCNRIVADRLARCKLVTDGDTTSGRNGVVCDGGDMMDDGKHDGGQGATLDAVAHKEQDQNDAVIAQLASAAATAAAAASMDGVETVADGERGRLVSSSRIENEETMNAGGEIFVPAKERDVQELEELLVHVSAGMTVDALEGLVVRCDKVLHCFRRSMDRGVVVRELVTMVDVARDDPALVGKLVA